MIDETGAARVERWVNTETSRGGGMHKLSEVLGRDGQPLETAWRGSVWVRLEDHQQRLAEVERERDLLISKEGPDSFWWAKACARVQGERDALQRENQVQDEQIERLERENQEWKIALTNLTPGGSEYANDSARCARYVQEARESTMEVIKKFKRERDEAKRALAAVRAAIVWALGYTDFPSRKEGEGAYWWRPELRRRSGITQEQIEQALAGRKGEDKHGS